MAPLLLLLWLGSALAARQLLPEPCQLGPEVWCRDPGTAARCGGSKECALLEQRAPQRSGGGRQEAPAITCGICTKVLAKLKSLVADNTDDENVVQAEGKVCRAVPRLVRQGCVSLIKKFKAKIAEALEAGGEPREICARLRMCRKPPPLPGAPLPPSDTCELCLTFTSRAQPDLRSPVPGRDLEGVLNGTCKRHFGGSPRCNDFVSAYGARLLTALKASQEPLALCLDTEACRLPEELELGIPALARTAGHGREASGTYIWSCQLPTLPALPAACLLEGTSNSPGSDSHPLVWDG